MSEEVNATQDAVNPPSDQPQPESQVGEQLIAPSSVEVATAPATPQPAPSSRGARKFNNPYIWGTGRRKAAVARVRIKPGEGKFIVNKKEMTEFFCVDVHRGQVREPLKVTETEKAFDVFVNVRGGGITGQAGAITLGLARALAKSDPAHEPKLREQGLLSRDPRRVERKKYGQRGARRRFQFSKR